MPKGNPSKQTIASEKYQKKAGYKSKSYKFKILMVIVESFPRILVFRSYSLLTFFCTIIISHSQNTSLIPTYRIANALFYIFQSLSRNAILLM